eukprot:TRINITY_DN6_c1_g3_i1.p1 TRINITY_DN6_c1_g3~~TRINITY_DN6_c1_g3_i1.p1  ORF type:complete len:371 (-),score=150.95 TRINITY_DN6_c1_g3_i1:194-1225(-)
MNSTKANTNKKQNKRKRKQNETNQKVLIANNNNGDNNHNQQKAIKINKENNNLIQENNNLNNNNDNINNILSSENNFRSKQRVLILASRGVTSQQRHLMKDLRKLLPHHKKEPKFDQKESLKQINEICEMRSCNNCIFFEARKHLDLYMWLSKTPNGPSAKFLVLNVHTMSELRLTGNSLLGSRPILTFDKNFDSTPQNQVLKELFIQTFGTPNRHPKSKPFIDHVLSFSIVDDKIWFRNYQIEWPTVETIDIKNPEANKPVLVEIGPRFVLQLIRLFKGSFGGDTIYQSGNYIAPNSIRSLKRLNSQSSYINRVAALRAHRQHIADNPLPPPNDFSEVFENY